MFGAPRWRWMWGLSHPHRLPDTGYKSERPRRPWRVRACPTALTGTSRVFSPTRFNQKGGAGKTTACVNLAGGLAEAGYSVLLVDADPQASALNWRNNSGEENLLGFQAGRELELAALTWSVGTSLFSLNSRV